LLVLFIFSIGATQAFGADNQVSVDYEFNRPYVVPVNIGGVDYDRVIMENADLCGNPGQPRLPSRGARILLPPQSEVSSIEVIQGERIKIGEGYNIEPTAVPHKLSAPHEARPPVPDQDIYGSRNSFPVALHEQVSVQNFRGYSVLILKLNPVEYIPLTGELYYYPDLEIRVNTISTGKAHELFRGLLKDREEVEKRIDNPSETVAYNSLPAPDKNPAEMYDLLIITSYGMESSFQPLKDFHDSTGISTIIRTDKNAPISNPEALRNFIRNAYNTMGIQYVLIAADDDIIPAADLYVRSWSGYDAEIEYNMPADVYFGCLDGTYNYDEDTQWGEPTDGEGGGDVDLMAEVYIGRASVGNSAEAGNFVNKTIAYITQPVSTPYLQNVCLVGENLGFGGESEWGGNCMDELKDSLYNDGYFTIGIPTIQYDVDELYDRDWPGQDWPKVEMKNRINAGKHFINHLGHGSQGYGLKMYNSDVSSLTNTDYCFIYSQTCLAGHFDDYECFAEYMTIKYMNAAFAIVMNARYGWGEYNSTDGPSHRFHREFVDAIYGEDLREFSKANQDSKEDNLYRINQSCMRWCYYELNLFGDPTIAMKENCVDSDGDGYSDPGFANENCPLEDNCPNVFNPDQIDSDGDGYGDSCDLCADFDDNIDSDGDGMPDLCDVCPGYDDFLDTDEDGMPDDCDNCPEVANMTQDDTDGDGVGDLCDVCPGFDDNIDDDNDGVPDGCDICAGFDDAVDSDDDGVPDGCDACAGYDDNVDSDGDAVADGCDNCPADENPGQEDNDNDGVGNICDNCPIHTNTDQADSDQDGVGNVCDNCHQIPNSDQADSDGDGFGDLCDNCPNTWNPGQEDENEDGVGDVCEWICGDCNADGNVNVSDAVFIINFVFVGGSEPEPMESGEVNCDGGVNVSDAVYIINYVFVSGSEPCSCK